METENLTQYTRPQKAFSIGLRTHWVCCTDLKIFFRPSPYAIFPISIPVFRMIVPEVAQHLPEIRVLCQRYGVERMSLFGSATNQEKFSPETSDVDCLVKFFNSDQPGIAHRYWELAESLEKTLNRSVDLITKRSVRNPFFQALVQQSKVSIYDNSNKNQLIFRAAI